MHPIPFIYFGSCFVQSYTYHDVSTGATITKVSEVAILNVFFYTIRFYSFCRHSSWFLLLSENWNSYNERFASNCKQGYYNSNSPHSNNVSPISSLSLIFLCTILKVSHILMGNQMCTLLCKIRNIFTAY